MRKETKEVLDTLWEKGTIDCYLYVVAFGNDLISKNQTTLTGLVKGELSLSQELRDYLTSMKASFERGLLLGNLNAFYLKLSYGVVFSEYKGTRKLKQKQIFFRGTYKAQPHLYLNLEEASSAFNEDIEYVLNRIKKERTELNRIQVALENLKL